MALRKKPSSRKSRRRGSRRINKTYGGNILDWFGKPTDTSNLPACPAPESGPTAGSVPANIPPPPSDYASNPPPSNQSSYLNVNTPQGSTRAGNDYTNTDSRQYGNDRRDSMNTPDHSQSYSSPPISGGRRHKRRKTKRSSRKHRGRKSSKRRYSSR
jgi:hypothetical protein